MSEIGETTRYANLKWAFDLFKAQGFQEPFEMFVLGFLYGKGGEKYFIKCVRNDLGLLAENPEFWKPIVMDCQRIREKIVNEDIRETKAILRELLKKRGVKPPEWLTR